MKKIRFVQACEVLQGHEKFMTGGEVRQEVSDLSIDGKSDVAVITKSRPSFVISRKGVHVEKMS